MRKIIVVTALVLATLTGLVHASVPGLNRLNITNGTGKTIQFLFISPGDSANWGPDMLGKDVLLDGDEIAYFMHYPQTTGNFDIMAIDSDNQRYEIRNFLLTDGTEGMLTIASENRTVVGAPQLLNVTLNNTTGFEMHFVFFFFFYSTMWGADILGVANTLGDGASHTFAILRIPNATKYDIWCVDINGDNYKLQVTIKPHQANFTFDIELDHLSTE